MDDSQEASIFPSEDPSNLSRESLPKAVEEAIGLQSLPNDLTRMLYLASLRDCNSGRYLHPELSPGIGLEEAHQALSASHDRVFKRLLTIPISQFVSQLDVYIGYARTERKTILLAWESLEAYRATVPLRALPVYRDLFVLNVQIALAVLDRPSVAIENPIQ